MPDEDAFGGGIDDWELDDWDDDAFDDDEWDATQVGLRDPLDADLDELDEFDEDAFEAEVHAGLLDDVSGLDDPTLDGPGLDDPRFDEPGLDHPLDPARDRGAGGRAAASGGRGATGERRMSWSAWEVGTVFALGGWLADRHAEHVGRQVAEVLGEPQPRDDATRGNPRAGPRQAPSPPPSSGYPYEEDAGPLGEGEPLDQGRLYAEVFAAIVQGDDLVIQAEDDPGSGDGLVLIISVVPQSPGPRLWLVAEEHPGGFAATRLMPVFQRDRDAGVAVFATDYAVEVADAAAWACAREGVALHELEVTHRRAGR